MFLLGAPVALAQETSRQVPFNNLVTTLPPGTTQSVVVQLWDAANGGTLVFYEQQSDLAVVDDGSGYGLVSFMFGSLTPPGGLDPAHFPSGTSRWLDVVQGNVSVLAGGRMALTATSFALSPGPQGPPGERGDPGPPGAAGPPGVVQTVTAADVSVVVGGTLADPNVAVAAGGIIGSHIASGQVVRSVNTFADNVTVAAGPNVTITSAPPGTLTVAAPNLLSAVTHDVALSGAGTSGSPLSIAAGGVTGGHIASGSVTGAHIAASSVTGSNIASGTVTGANIASGAVNTGQLADSAVTSTKLAPGAVTGWSISVPVSLSGSSGSPIVAAANGGGGTGAWASGGNGVWGVSPEVNGNGVLGEAFNGASAFGVWGRSTNGMGVVGDSGAGVGVRGWTTSGIGVQAAATSGSGVEATSTSGTGVLGSTAATGFWLAAVRGSATSTDGTGVLGEANGPNAKAVWGRTTGGFAGYFDGKVQVNGYTITRVLQITGGADLSERFWVREARKAIEPGLVVTIDPEHPGQLTVSKIPYDRKVAGIISGAGGVNPGLLMGQSGSAADGAHPVALTGRVYCWADASNGPIQAGDLLTTSSVPGQAMKVTDYRRAQGAILGKAMTGLAQGRGLVLVLVTLQ